MRVRVGQAEIVLQETEGLKLAKTARLVGNFQSEEELYVLFSRFAPQLRDLPFGLQTGSAPPLELREGGTMAPREVPEKGSRGEARTAQLELPDLLQEALRLLAGESELDPAPKGSGRIIQEIVNLLQAGDLEALRHTYQTLFGRIECPTDEIVRSEKIIREHFLTEAS